jgi:hypothetical protein
LARGLRYTPVKRLDLTLPKIDLEFWQPIGNQELIFFGLSYSSLADRKEWDLPDAGLFAVHFINLRKTA